MARRDWPGRRYPPTPYGPRTEETRTYRDYWDDGYEHLGQWTADMMDSLFEGLTSEPARRGYLDGSAAKFRRLLAAAKFDREIRIRDAKARLQEERLLASQERPY